MSTELSHSSLKKLEKAVFASETQDILDEIQNEINQLERKVTTELKEKYQDVINFCVSLNKCSESLNELIDMNNWIKEDIEESKEKLQSDITEYESTLQIEKNLNNFIKVLRNILLFEEEIVKIETSDNPYFIVEGIRKLDNSLLEFKNFNFHHKYYNKLTTLKSMVLKNTRKEAEAWLEYNKMSYESIGCQFFNVLREKESLIFDVRFNFWKNADMQRLYDFLYIFSCLKSSKDLINRLNTFRESYLVQVSSENDNLNSSLYTTIGIFLLEFYLMEINTTFDLKETYKKITQAIFERIKQKEEDPIEQKAYFIAMKQTFTKLRFDTNLVDDEILQLALSYFQEQKKTIKSVSEIEQYISNIQRVLPGLDNQDVETLFYKNVDDVLLQHANESEEYSTLLEGTQNKYPNFKFRAALKHQKTTKDNQTKIRTSFIDIFNHIMDIRDIDEFQQRLETEMRNLKLCQLKPSDLSTLAKQIREKCTTKLLVKEKNSPNDKVNQNAKRALFTKTFDQQFPQ